MSKREECLEEARRAVTQRAGAYGSPVPLFNLIAKRWSMTLGVVVTARQVALCMVDMKVARAVAGAPDDTAIDIAGYAACLFEIDAHYRDNTPPVKPGDAARDCGWTGRAE